MHYAGRRLTSLQRAAGLNSAAHRAPATKQQRPALAGCFVFLGSLAVGYYYSCAFALVELAV